MSEWCCVRLCLLVHKPRWVSTRQYQVVTVVRVELSIWSTVLRRNLQYEFLPPTCVDYVDNKEYLARVVVPGKY